MAKFIFKKTLGFLMLACFLFVIQVQAQNKNASNYVKYISTDYMKDCLFKLASPTFEGRETATRGQKLAAAFIQYEFEHSGLLPIVPGEGATRQYQMHFPVVERNLEEAKVILSGKNTATKALSFKKEFVYLGFNGSNGLKTLEFIFAGTGTPEELNNINVLGKAVVVCGKAPEFEITTTVMKNLSDRGAKLLIVGREQPEEKFLTFYNRYKSYMMNTEMTLPQDAITKDFIGTLYMSFETVAKLFNQPSSRIKKMLDDYASTKNVSILKRINSQKHQVDIRVTEKKMKTENVLGYLEGTDLKDELLVVTAHYDHLGKKGKDIYFGADDDGSGTSAVLAMAKAFSMAKKQGNGPRRSILFMTVSGEEKGLLGSEWYVSNPIFPLKQTVTDLNIDMIGRTDPNYTKKDEYIYLVGSDKLSNDLHTLSEKTNTSTVNLKLDYTYNDENHPDRIYYRSDHWNFAKNKIPVIFYFDGIHEDYHKPTDTPDKINYDLLKKRTELVFYTAWEIANRTERLKLNK